MFVIVAKIFAKGFQGMAIYPFVFIKHSDLKNNPRFLNHEKIHLRQQIELFWIVFFLWYGLEYLCRLIHYKNANKAYKNISFEREAYQNQHNQKYLAQRKLWSFLKYL